MAKFCKQCGVKHSNNAFTCASCGAPFPDGRDTPNLMKYIRICLHSILPVLAVILLIMHFTGPTAAARRIMKAYQQNDAETVINSYPSFLLESDMLDKEAFIRDTISEVEQISNNLASFRMAEIQSPSPSEREAVMYSIGFFAPNSFREDDIKNIKIVWVIGNFVDADSVDASGIPIVMIKYKGHWYWWPYA